MKPLMLRKYWGPYTSWLEAIGPPALQWDLLLATVGASTLTMLVVLHSYYSYSTIYLKYTSG